MWAGDQACVLCATRGPPAVPPWRRTAIWHGSGDRIVPPLHAEYYADAIPGSQLRLVEGEGHVSLVGLHGGEILGDVLRWAEARGQPSAEVVEVAAEPVAQPVLRAIEVCA